MNQIPCGNRRPAQSRFIDRRRAYSAPPVLTQLKTVAIKLASTRKRASVERELHQIAGQTAFRLVELLPASDGVLGHWQASFQLQAADGVVGDAQIYALLRLFSGATRWIAVSKMPTFAPLPALAAIDSDGGLGAA